MKFILTLFALLLVPLDALLGAETVVYKTVEGRELKLFIDRPAAGKATNQRPAIVFYFGGGWVGGTPEQFRKQSEYLATRGLVGIRAEYRTIPKGDKGPPVICCADAKSAMRYVRAHAKELGIDPKRIAAAGGSAGGHLAAFTALVDGLDDSKDDLKVSCKPDALLLFNPVFNNGPGQWGHERVGERFMEFSPAHHITKAAPPAIVFLGDQDKLIPVSVLRDLKPIWLMSPLSVSDTLPLTPDLFDVVIFDEASQIPVEEAVPALYRAPQVIVVGDEMQLPPTNFFSAARSTDDETIEVEEDGERVAVSLDADSFLTQSAKNLPATLLAWHYRSRSESLIGFSNAAFYAGNLYTIPDRALPAPEQAEIIVRFAADAATTVDALLGRPLSFHHLERSPYDARRNAGEAAYIAQLVRELLRRETKRHVGIVAFSEAQQGEIESALESLASEDADFAARLEQEYVREDEDQFVGLFVKNLENVQGDERDIILLSICYGPDASGKMLMNFGPINQRGGEKRLNVIFSRARHHMAVVSSIRHTAITNDYNDGAAALKNFLHYAECSSRGDRALAATVLQSLNPLTRKQLANTTARDAVIAQLATALRERGFTVDERVGQSRFRCDLGIRASDASAYAAGIIVDTAPHYENPDVAERCITQPGILRAFGWRVALVLTRDWYSEPQAVLDRLIRLTRGEAEPALAIEDDAPPPVPVVLPPAAPITEPSTAAPHSTGHALRLEFVAGSSAKFWEIAQDGVTLSVRYGRIGTNGQLQTKTYDTSDRATREREKLTAEKLRKGYQEANTE